MNKKHLYRAGATILTAIMLLGPLTSCQNRQVYETAQTESVSGDYSSSSNKPTSKPSQEMTLADVNPTFKQSGSHLTIDEKSALQIVQIALNDAQEFFEGMGAPNMKYDKNLKVVEGKENFYTDWMNEYFYLARAMSESSLRVDVKTQLPTPTECGDYYAVGPMQLCENSIKSTLMQYYRDVFNEKIDLTQLSILPSEKDIQNVNNSKQSRDKVVEAIYNNIYLSICFDIYNTKCLNPIKHQDYYSAYGGFDEDVRKLAAIGMYCSSRGTVISGLKNGNLENVLRSNKDINTYLNNLKKYENQYRDKYNDSEMGFQQ